MNPPLVFDAVHSLLPEHRAYRGVGAVLHLPSCAKIIKGHFPRYLLLGIPKLSNRQRLSGRQHLSPRRAHPSIIPPFRLSDPKSSRHQHLSGRRRLLICTSAGRFVRFIYRIPPTTLVLPRASLIFKVTVKFRIAELHSDLFLYLKQYFRKQKQFKVL